MAMNPEIKAKWLEALRSGRYTQAKEQLHIKDDGFCCLGVLCDVLDPTQWKDEYGAMYYCGERSTLPDNILMTVELGANRCVSIPSRVHLAVGYGVSSAKTLAEMNDRGATFEEIADIIEKEL